MKDIIEFIKTYYPITTTKHVANKLGLSESKVRSIAKKYDICKSEDYLNMLKFDFIESRKKWFRDSIPKFEPTHIQEQIIFGSLLGDGYISKGAQRSKNYYYQEHFGEKQREYREWKLAYLIELGFSINGNYLRSKSHPHFTHLYTELYPQDKKTLTSKFLSKCTHPIFLATLYLDDGSLVFSYRYNKNKNFLYCHPTIFLYMLCFSREENMLLCQHLNQQFGINFVVSGHPDGKGSLLKINKEEEVRKFLSIIQPLTNDIKGMSYKVTIEENLAQKLPSLREKFGSEVNIKLSSSTRQRIYGNEEIEILINLKNQGATDQEIANNLNRSYWSVVYKIKELRKSGRIL